MKINKKLNYKFLLENFSTVNTYVEKGDADKDIIETIISFCIVTEKILKINLYKKNPILIYPEHFLKKEDLLCLIGQKKEDSSLETIKIASLLSRYIRIFPRRINNDDKLIISNIFSFRNKILHSPSSDEDIINNAENIYKKISTVWEKISKEVSRFFGDKIKVVKPKRKYSENEIDEFIKKELYEKINSRSYDSYNSTSIFGFPNQNSGLIDMTRNSNNEVSFLDTSILNQSSKERIFSNSILSDDLMPYGDKCPRCKHSTLQIEYQGIYVCKKCNLELTSKEYEIVKKAV